MKKNNKKDEIKNKSLNYPIDSHKKFCLRCFAHNGGCPSTGSKRKSSTCQL